MKVARLDIIRYETADGPWDTKTTNHPVWADVERAIRQMDRCHYPFVQLYLQGQPADADVPDLEITGGAGAYSLQVRTDGQNLLYQNPDGRDDVEVERWQSDQGGSLAERDCASLDTVLQAAQYFFEHGLPDPRLQWA